MFFSFFVLTISPVFELFVNFSLFGFDVLFFHFTAFRVYFKNLNDLSFKNFNRFLF